MFIMNDPLNFSEILYALLKSFLVLLLSSVYAIFYIRTRKAYFLQTGDGNAAVTKAVLCLGTDLLLFLTARSAGRSFMWVLWIFLLGILEDTDILIRKIPTELLILTAVLTFRLKFPFMEPAAVIFGTAVTSLWFLLRKKTGICLYDIFLIMILTLAVGKISSILIFEAFILILWGLTGLILQFVFRKDPQTKIPLVPVAVSAFMLVQLYR